MITLYIHPIAPILSPESTHKLIGKLHVHRGLHVGVSTAVSCSGTKELTY